MSQHGTARSSSGILEELFIQLKPFRLMVTLSVLLGMVGGLSVKVLLALISTPCSDIGSSYVVQHLIAKLRKELGEKLLSARISQIERYRRHRLIPVLTHDVDTLSDLRQGIAHKPPASPAHVCAH